MGQRRRQRFSDLERQFRESGGVAAPGSRLAGYIDFKQGKTKIDVNVKLTAAQRKRFGFAIIPFNTPVADPAERVAAPITAYSNTGRTTLTLSDAELGYANISGTTIQSENFYPALLRVFVPTPGAAPGPAKSGVTQKTYTRTPGRSFSVPFGRAGTTPATDTEEVRKSILANKAKTGAGDNKATGVSYQPEVFKIGKPDLASPTA